MASLVSLDISFGTFGLDLLTRLADHRAEGRHGATSDICLLLCTERRVHWESVSVMSTLCTALSESRPSPPLHSHCKLTFRLVAACQDRDLRLNRVRRNLQVPLPCNVDFFSPSPQQSPCQQTIILKSPVL
jgi:hypothetical protein